jgi:5'-3' exonuclease
MENGLDDMVAFYKRNAKHLVDLNGNINLATFKTFLQYIASSERDMMIQKIKHRNEYIEDTLLSKWSNPDDFVLEEYQELYRTRHSLVALDNVCHSYLQGCHWVLSYYLNGISNWDWMYRYNYAPFASDLVKHIDTFKVEPFRETSPLLPIQQLLCVLPPKSFKFVPKQFQNFYRQFPEFYPDKFNINYEGKKKKWEGIVELPSIDVNIIKEFSDPIIGSISPQDAARNQVCVPVVYKDSDYLSDFKSQFGTIRKCRVDIEIKKF